MAVLTAHRSSGPRRQWRAGLGLAFLALAFAAGPATTPARAEPAREYQVKAVFLFNFTQFVEWPDDAFPDAGAPFAIGVLGQDPFENYLDEVTNGERVEGRPLVVRRCRNLEEAATCQILFVSRSESSRLVRIVAALRGRPVLTVGDADDFARRGGIVRLLKKNNRIHLRINLGAAKAARLTISSQLLRPSELVAQEETAP